MSGGARIVMTSIGLICVLKSHYPIRRAAVGLGAIYPALNLASESLEHGTYYPSVNTNYKWRTSKVFFLFIILDLCDSKQNIELAVSGFPNQRTGSK